MSRNINDVMEEFYKKKVKIKTSILKNEESISILIEGDRVAFGMIADLFQMMADSDGACELSIAPDAAGSSHFASGSTIGLYLNKLDED